MRYKNEVVLALLVLVGMQVLFIGAAAKEWDSARQAMGAAFDQVEDLRMSQYEWLIRVQSNELLSLRHAYLSMLDTTRDPLSLFTEHIFATRVGMDGEGIVAIFDGKGSLIYASDRAFSNLTELLPYVGDTTDILYPSHFMTGPDPDGFPYPSIRFDRVYWNKMVIPHPTHEDTAEKLAIFFGFRERVVLWESGTAFARARTTIHEAFAGSSKVLTFSALLILGVFFVSSYLIFKLRQLLAFRR